MTLRIFCLIIFSVGLSALAQISLKRGMSSDAVGKSFDATNFIEIIQTIFSSPYVILGLSLYGFGAVLWLFVLAKLDVTTAYPFVGLGFILTMILGAWLLGETLTVSKIIGTLLVSIGIVFVAR